MDASLWLEEEFTKKMEEQWQHLLPLPPKYIRIHVTYAAANRKATPFWVEVDIYNDTVLKLKEKIHMRIRSRSMQVNNMILRLERTHGTLLLLDHDQLLTNCGFKPNCHVLVEVGEQVTSSDPVVVKVFSFKSTLLVEMKLNDTVLKLKEKIHETNEAMELERMVLLRSDETKYDDDHKLLRDCGVMINKGALEIWVYAYVTSGGPERLKVKVVLRKNGTCMMIPVEVNAYGKVRELKKELEKLHLPEDVVPRDGLYGFSYKEVTMNDRMPFEWHQVQQGDAIHLLSDVLVV